MNLNLPIPVHTIHQITQISKGHPVYLVVLENSDTIVIKREDSKSDRMVENSAEIMRVIDPNAFSRVMKKEELIGLQKWVQANQQWVTENQGEIGRLLESITDAVKAPTPSPNGTINNQQGVMVVMHTQKNLMQFDSALAKRLAGDKTGVRGIAAVLNEISNLEKVGELMAGDAFNNNIDRAYIPALWMSGKQGTKLVQEFGKDCERLNVITNIGNFFFGSRTDTAKPTVLAMDYFDPQSIYHDWNTLIRVDDQFNVYAGKILHPRESDSRMRLAQMLVADFEFLLGPRNRKMIFGRTERLPKSAAKHIADGIVTGGRKIYMHLKWKYKSKPISPGFQSRLAILGWDLNA